MGVTAQHLPILVAGHERDLLDFEARLEKPARPFMSKVVEVKVFDLQLPTGPCEPGAHRLMVETKDPIFAIGAKRPLFFDQSGGVVA
jgi:hypothetical protein